MNLEELQTALNDYDEAWVDSSVDYDPKPIVEAARLVANPNLKAMGKVNYALSHNDYSEAELRSLFAAALTPGDTNE